MTDIALKRLVSSVSHARRCHELAILYCFTFNSVFTLPDYDAETDSYTEKVAMDVNGMALRSA